MVRNIEVTVRHVDDTVSVNREAVARQKRLIGPIADRSRDLRPLSAGGAGSRLARMAQDLDARPAAVVLLREHVDIDRPNVEVLVRLCAEGSCMLPMATG